MSEDNDDGAVPAALTPEEFQQIPESLQPKLERFMHFEMMVGPLPPPEMLARYDNVLPGLPAKLVTWTEDESAHRRQLQTNGQRYAFAATMASFVAAVAIAGFANSVAFAVVAGICPIVGVGGTVAARVLAGRWGSGPSRQLDPPEH